MPRVPIRVPLTIAACAALLTGCASGADSTDPGSTTGTTAVQGQSQSAQEGASQPADPQDKPKTGEQPEFASGNDLLASVNTDLINAGATPCAWDVKSTGPKYNNPEAFFKAVCDHKSAGELEFESSTDKPHGVDVIYWHPDPAVLKESVIGDSENPVWATGKNWVILTDSYISPNYPFYGENAEASDEEKQSWRDRADRVRAETGQMLGVRFTDGQDAGNQLTTGIDGNGSGTSGSSGASATTSTP